MSTTEHDHCPRCGAPLSGGLVDGLCARCLGGLNLEIETLPTDPGHGSFIPPLEPEELAPFFPQLEIHSCLGRGGMGVVYKARQKSLDRWVALKLLAPERAGDPAFAERFAREAKALATLNHPHIVAIHDFGQAGGYFYLLMEYVDGVNLRQLLQSKKLTAKEALNIVPPICDALQCAHERGIVHRDIKPENLLIDRSGTVKIADFGIARVIEAPVRDDTDDHFVGHTQAIGTPDYAAPEQRTRSAIDQRADIYSLGVVLYEMLTGERPGDKNIIAPSRRIRLDVHIDEIVLKALAEKPELRFNTVEEFRTRLEDAERKWEHAARRPRWYMAAGITAAMILAAMVVIWMQAHRNEAKSAPSISPAPAVITQKEEPTDAVRSKLGYLAIIVPPAQDEEGASDTIIRKDGKDLMRIPWAVPVSFSPDGRLLLLHEAAADDDTRHFIIDVTAENPAIGDDVRQRIGSRRSIFDDWNEDGRSIHFKEENVDFQTLPIPETIIPK